MKKKWSTKYVKLTLKDIDEPWYIPEKNKRYGLGNVWYIVKETAPGEWEEIRCSEAMSHRSSPEPLDIWGGYPNIDCFDYEELTEKEAFVDVI